MRRLRCLCGYLQERICNAVRRRQGEFTRPPASGPSRSQAEGKGYGGKDGRAGLRQLHEHPCMRDGMPQGHHRRAYRKAQQGVPQGQVLRLSLYQRKLLNG